jgi:hypothetical protein
MENMNQAQGVNPGTASGSLTWPRDVLTMAKDLPRHHANHLQCFLACPFDPSERADDLLAFTQSVCDEIGKEVGADIQCVRSDKISTPGTIHADIWKYLELADALIFDVTGGNGNVLLELGVAAACRSQDNVVILRDRADTKISKFLFDIAPSRHLLYNLSLSGSREFGMQLKEALIHALTPAPYEPYPEYKTSFPLEIDLSKDGGSIDLLSPPMLHRRVMEDGLEFGSVYFFQHSWITVGDDDHSRVQLEATMRFSECAHLPDVSDGWIGIALRSQHSYANFSHLVYLKPDGSVWYTKPLDEWNYEDVLIDSLKGFSLSDFVKFHLSFGQDVFRIEVRSKDDVVSKTINLRSPEDSPYIRHAGKIRLQTRRCRAVLQRLYIDVDD